ncbi:hypothetical protein FA15DRAFT_662558 [Coprinopsis marcescibilis]|uniref:SAP domain-containing protein n=1 Tax=Coprinopsis marcescibilis TaxID=230819 RepID=A0A5C3LCR4_COPMA|nr:hypothetical protein FA15DRAFT_662558 [Coprinopsis marcescibilis]
MAPLPSKQVLESMKRVDLQRLCKDYGVRANLKSEALIDLLLETQSVPPPSPARRNPSTRKSSRAGPSRTTSLIIHDIDEGVEDENDDASAQLDNDISPPLEEPAPSPAPVRTRKAKDLQTSLGVGRPKAVGGAGARAVTKSFSTQRSRRGQSSRMMSRVEATIEEEPEPPHANASGSYQVHATPTPQPMLYPQTTGSQNIVSSPDISKQISDAVKPLQTEIQALQQTVQSLQQRNSEVEQLKTQVSNLAGLQEKYLALEAEVRELRLQPAKLTALQEEVRLLKEFASERTSPPLPMTPIPRSPRIPLANRGVVPSAFQSNAYPPLGNDTSPLDSPMRESSAAPPLPHPGYAQTILGKRPRDSIASNPATLLEENQQDSSSEEGHAMKTTRPSKKRPRLSSTAEMAVAGPSKASSSDVAAQLAAPRIPSFPIFDSEDALNESYIDPPPPTNSLPNFFGDSEDLDMNGQSSGQHNDQNLNIFNFNFLPASSTPAHPQTFTAPFPFPEPPQSPSPAGSSLGYLGHPQDNRTDIFQSFGLPSPRAHRPAETQSGDTVNPASLGGRNTTGKQREVSSNDVAVGLGLTMVRTSSVTDPMNHPEPPPAKKTMYGTELEGETRFGDFGVEGVASGFWSGR